MSARDHFSEATSRLIESLRVGAQQEVASAKASGASVNERGKNGITPAIYAVLQMDASILSALLELGGDPNNRQQDGHNAVTAAYELSGSRPDLLSQLIRSGRADVNVLMPDGEPMLYYLIGTQRLDLLKLALQHGGNPSLKTRAGRELVIAAALIQEYDAAGLLLDAGASPNAADRAGTSLMTLVEKGPSQRINPGGATNQSRLRLLERLHKSGAK